MISFVCIRADWVLYATVMSICFETWFPFDAFGCCLHAYKLEAALSFPGGG